MSNFSVGSIGMYNNNIHNDGYAANASFAGKGSALFNREAENPALSGRGKETQALPGLKEEQEKERKERLGIKDPTEECQTCKNRKYQDGSDEMVSFKSATHLSPESAASAVRAHEQEHVSNAYAKAATGNGKVISASVSIHTAVCPECGRTYVSGGTTQTQIKYYNEDNPYQKDLKLADQAKYSGMNADYTL
ncbi:MAG: hypothetical protein ACI4AB_08295 [Acetatifactor sp.]